MSEGPRLPHAKAASVAAALFEKWELTSLLADHSAACVVVGSVRRRLEEVGDLEIIAPLPAGWESRKLAAADDPLFRRINATMSNPWTDEANGLFVTERITTEPGGPDPIGQAVRGLKPGFLAASLIVEPWDGVSIPVQVYRYSPDNRGWLLIERTGPRDFGMWFLGQWKRRFGIPLGDAGRPASVKGHLIDVASKVVSVPTEEEAFRLAGIQPVPPERRDAFMQHLQSAREAQR